MYQLIQISKLNDFIFDPDSLYYHAIYESFDTSVYHETPQIEGNQAHDTIDNRRYSTQNKILQGTPVYSEKYRLVGKIDTFNITTGQLVERKKKVKKIYLGYEYQLYAQMICLEEMGYQVNSLWIHSLDDNRRYEILPPTRPALEKFEEFLKQIRNYQFVPGAKEYNQNKLDNCIYRHLYV